MPPVCRRTGPELAELGLARGDHSTGPGTAGPVSRAELDGLTIQRKLVKGDAAWAIVQTAQEEKADLIMMPSHSFTFTSFFWAL